MLMAPSKNAFVWMVPSGPFLGWCTHAEQVAGIACGPTVRLDKPSTLFAWPVLEMSQRTPFTRVAGATQGPLAPTHSYTFLSAKFVPPPGKFKSTSTSPIECEAKGALGSLACLNLPSEAATTGFLKNQAPMNAVPLVSYLSAPKARIESPAGLPVYFAAYAFRISSLGGE